MIQILLLLILSVAVIYVAYYLKKSINADDCSKKGICSSCKMKDNCESKKED